MLRRFKPLTAKEKLMKFMNLSFNLVILPVLVYSERVCASDLNDKSQQQAPVPSRLSETALAPFRNPSLSPGATIPSQVLGQQPPPAYSPASTHGQQLPTAPPRDQPDPRLSSYSGAPFPHTYSGYPPQQLALDPRLSSPYSAASSVFGGYPQQHPADLGAAAYALHVHQQQAAAISSSYPPAANFGRYSPHHPQPFHSVHSLSSLENAPYLNIGNPYALPQPAGSPVLLQGPSSAANSPASRRRTISGAEHHILGRLSLGDSESGATATDDGEQAEEEDDEGTGEHSLDMLGKDRKALMSAWASLVQAADAKETALAALLQNRRKSSVSAGEKSPKEKSPTSVIGGAKKAYKEAKKLVKGKEAMEEDKLAQEEEEYEAQARPVKKLIRKERRQYLLLVGHINTAIAAINLLSLDITPKK